MTTLYKAAVRNYRAAADVLEALQFTRQNLVDEARIGLVGRPRLGLVGNYNDVTAQFGICLPHGSRGELLIAEGGTGIELRCNGADWLTLEGSLPLPVEAETCHVEMQIDSDRPVIADLFLREIHEDGSVRDSGHRTCHQDMDAVGVCRLDLPELSGDVGDLRVIIHLRQPAPRMILDLMSITLT